jgi:hypothetical protein
MLPAFKLAAILPPSFDNTDAPDAGIIVPVIPRTDYLNALLSLLILYYIP